MQINPQNLFEELVSYFPKHNDYAKSSFTLKKLDLENDIEGCFTDRERVDLVLKALIPLNEDLKNINLYKRLIKSLKQYNNWFEYLNSISEIIGGISAVISNNYLKNQITGDKTSILPTKYSEEWRLIKNDPNFTLHQQFSPSKTFNQSFDKYTKMIIDSFHCEGIIHNKHIYYDLNNLQRDMIDD